jgi:D-alanyl-D-alanine dipeptidase
MTLFLILGNFPTNGVADLHSEKLPKGFVYLRDVDASILQEIRYSGSHNFVGRPIPGYFAEECILTQEAAEALAKVQGDLKSSSLTLKVYDCYRPHQAVQSFVKWAKDLEDQKMKKEFYPFVNKRALFVEGYISSKSGHSRGSTVDLTLVQLPVKPQPSFQPGQPLVECTQDVSLRFKDNMIDFGTGYDCFDSLAHTLNPAIKGNQKKNRMILKSAMEKRGFRNLSKEWWHYTLKSEPFPKQSFNFPVQRKE